MPAQNRSQPMTLGNMRQNGVRTLAAWCLAAAKKLADGNRACPTFSKEKVPMINTYPYVRRED
jgi:hypothetical protein